MTAGEFLSLGETSERYELIDGVVSMSPRPSRRHQRILCLLQIQLEAYVKSSPGAAYFPEIDIRFDKRHVYAPDLSCFAPGRAPSLDGPLDTLPDLIIEILSPSTEALDLVRKRADYGRLGGGGVREYWVVNPVDGSVRAFHLRARELLECEVSGDSLPSIALPGFTLALQPLKDLSSQD